ncbi:MAG: Ig-like domain-containing protein, partial [Mobilitalea sp.]
MKSLRKIFLFAGLILGVSVLYAGASGVKVQAAEAVSISQTTGALLPKETLQLSIKGTTMKAVWSSDDKEIATVTQAGKVTAKEYGATTIKAKVNNKTYECIIVVVDISCIEVNYDVDVLTTNGGATEIYAESFEYYEVMDYIDIDYKILDNNSGKIIKDKVDKARALISFYEDGDFEVEASFHGKKIGSYEFTSIQFPGFYKDKISLEAGDTGEMYVSLPYYYPLLEDITIASSDSSVAIAKPVKHADFDDTFVGYFCVKALKAGSAVITVKIADTSRTFQVNVTGEKSTPLYDPVQAVKLGKFDGYTGNELKSVLYVYDFIHDYGLDSVKMKDSMKMDYIQSLFYYLYYVRNYYKQNWTCYGEISQVLQTSTGLDSSISCAATVSYLLDCMDIPNYYCTGSY